MTGKSVTWTQSTRPAAISARFIDRLPCERNGTGDSSFRRVTISTASPRSTVASGRRLVANQSMVTAQVDGSRDQLAGVNLDEEMTNMLSFQHAYSAAARMVTAIDQALDTLINRTGRVGL